MGGPEPSPVCRSNGFGPSRDRNFKFSPPKRSHTEKQPGTTHLANSPSPPAKSKTYFWSPNRGNIQYLAVHTNVFKLGQPESFKKKKKSQPQNTPATTTFYLFQTHQFSFYLKTARSAREIAQETELICPPQPRSGRPSNPGNLCTSLFPFLPGPLRKRKQLPLGAVRLGLGPGRVAAPPPGLGRAPERRISADLRSGQRAAGPGQGAEKDGGRWRGSGTRGGEETRGRLCSCSEDSEADSALGRAGRPRHTRPRRPGTTARASERKEGHGLALGFRIVSEFDLLIPKKIIQSHVQK